MSNGSTEYAVKQLRINMKIYGHADNIYDAVDAVVEHGVAAVEGTKTPAVNYANRIIEALAVYPDVAATIGYQNVVNEGYLYYVFDTNKFGCGDSRLKEIINEIDESNA